FTSTGQPTNSPTSVNRPGTYTWAYFLRRRRSGDAAQTLLSVIVYASRPTDSIAGETTFNNGTAGVTITGLNNTNTVTITYPAGGKPNIRKGGWILDTTYQRYGPTRQPLVAGAVAPPGSTGTVNGDFYQVASVRDNSNTSTTLELE